MERSKGHSRGDPRSTGDKDPDGAKHTVLGFSGQMTARARGTLPKALTPQEGRKSEDGPLIWL